jgi:hypothetical protein
MAVREAWGAVGARTEKFKARQLHHSGSIRKLERPLHQLFTLIGNHNGE